MAVTSMCSITSHRVVLHHTTARPVLVDKKRSTYDTTCFLRFPHFNVRRNGSKWHSILKDANASSMGKYINKEKQIEAAPPFMVYGMQGDGKSTSENVSDKEGRPLEALDSYFGKLQKDFSDQSATSKTGSEFQVKSTEEYIPETKCEMNMDVNENNHFKVKAGLGSLDSYFDKLDIAVRTQTSGSESCNEDLSDISPTKDSTFIGEENHENDKVKVEKLKPLATKKNIDSDFSAGMTSDKSFTEVQPDNDEETSDFFLLNMLVSLNVAVFLFEIASPVGNSNLQPLSLPLLYGAKINSLILDGEWWRLVTPMFLHSGFLHVTFSCWALLTFGPQVCRVYGPFTFFLIYILGGICANITSFIHTPELAVCGTGPVFALIAACLVYQFQNKEAISEEVSESMYWKAVITTALSFLLSNGPTDEWVHLGAIFSGVVYGYFTCPKNELDRLSTTEESKKNSITLVGPKADPIKSSLFFLISILTLCPLVYMLGPDLDFSGLGNFLLK